MSQSEVVSLREYFEQLLKEYDLRYQQRFDASQDGIKQALTAAKEAVVKAEAAMEKRFDNTNEWRRTYEDLATKKLSRDEYVTHHEALNEKVANLQKRIDVREGSSSGMGVVVTAAISVLAAVVALLAIFLHH